MKNNKKKRKKKEIEIKKIKKMIYKSIKMIKIIKIIKIKRWLKKNQMIMMIGIDNYYFICKKNLDFFKNIIIIIHKLHLFKSFKKI